MLSVCKSVCQLHISDEPFLIASIVETKYLVLDVYLALSKNIFQTLNERRTYVVDSDREIQAIRLQRYEADREKDKARRLEARRGKRQKKKGARKQVF